MLSYIFGYEPEEPEADEKQVRLRHLLMRQIRNSNLKLRSIATPARKYKVTK